MAKKHQVLEQGSNRLDIGAIRFFNSKPLIYGLAGRQDVKIHYDVPAHLAKMLREGRCRVGLLSSIDIQLSDQPLWILPAGAICSTGEVLTVQLFSRIPFDQIQQVACDPDSHTAAILLKIIFLHSYGRWIRFETLDRPIGDYESVLLIGDKVIKQLGRWPYQADLGRQWADLTGLPFVYAVWAAKTAEDAERALPMLQNACREGIRHLDEIVAQYAVLHGFDRVMARRYLKEHLCYEFGPDQVEGLKRFYEMAYRMQLIRSNEPLRIARSMTHPLARG